MQIQEIKKNAIHSRKPILLFWLSIIVAVGLLSPITEINAQASRKAPCFIPNGDGTGGRVLTMNRQECESFFGTFDATSAPAREIRGENPSDIDCILYDADGVSNPRIVRMTRIVCESYHGTPSAANLGTGQPATGTNVNSAPVVAPTQSVTVFSFAEIDTDKPDVEGGLVPCGHPDAQGNITNPCSFKDALTLINTIIKFILFDLAIPIAAVMFAYAGFKLVTSGGSSEARGQAKNIFSNAVFGLVIAAGAWLIIRTILSVLGYQGAWIGF
ncbi:MAG: pilin [Candidatus Paceibacterota bacterium]|jgi:hypothetical protein